MEQPTRSISNLPQTKQTFEPCSFSVAKEAWEMTVDVLKGCSERKTAQSRKDATAATAKP